MIIFYSSQKWKIFGYLIFILLYCHPIFKKFILKRNKNSFERIKFFSGYKLYVYLNCVHEELVFLSIRLFYIFIFNII